MCKTYRQSRCRFFGERFWQERSGRPESASVKTLSILRDLDQNTADLFRILCSASVVKRTLKGAVLDARVPALGGSPGQNCLEKYGLSFGAITTMTEYGLIVSSYNTWHNYQDVIGMIAEARLLRLPFQFQGRSWVLIPQGAYDYEESFKLTGVALTKAGKELLEAVDLLPMSQFTGDLISFFADSKLAMTEADHPHPFVVGHWPPKANLA